jgi:hypothetical protein
MHSKIGFWGLPYIQIWMSQNPRKTCDIGDLIGCKILLKMRFKYDEERKQVTKVLDL